MVKEKPYDLILEPDSQCCYLMMAYSINSGKIKLPRMGWKYHDRSPFGSLSESKINFPLFIRCFSHEILIKWTHENEGLDAAKKLDDIDVTINEWGIRIFTGVVS
jgi:hypothetical protein